MIGTILLLFICLIAIYLWKNKRPDNFPPGPTPLPIIGNLMQLPKGHLYPTVEEWSKNYGPIIGISVFHKLTVMVTGIDNVLAALRKEEFQSRPITFSVKSRSYGKALGIFFSTGDQWNSSRKFTVKQMRAFGKFEKESLIFEEISRLMDTIKDGTMQANGLFGLAAVNVIWMLIANKRIDRNDEKSEKFLMNLIRFFRQGDPSGASIVDIFPIFRFISSNFKFAMKVINETHDFIKTFQPLRASLRGFCVGQGKGVSIMGACVHNLTLGSPGSRCGGPAFIMQEVTQQLVFKYSALLETIKEHRKTLDPNNPRDLIDNYLVEMDSRKGNSDSYFTEEDLIVIGTDLFSAGAESTSNSIEFVLLYMILYPDVQEKMQEEIDRVLGKGRKPVLNDKSNLHYTMAVLNEVERINSVVPTNVPHYCDKDTTFGGYFIPKGTTISMDFRTFGYDTKYWKNPEKFDPERFLNSDGQYVRPSNMATFGLGQRTCIGEMMARNIIFLFTTTFFEKCSITLPPGEPKPSTVALPGFTTAPKPFKINVKCRY